MELLQLRYFVTVAKLGSITKAANYHQIPQPAMSQTISRLEADLGGVKLFDRKSGHIYLNENGRRFLAHAENALHTLDSGIEELKSTNHEISGQIRLLVMENRRFIVKCVSQFSREHPSVSFYISHDFYSDQNTTYDLCLSSMQRYNNMRQSVPFIRERIVLAVHESNPLAHRPWVSLSELKDEKFITMPSRSSLYDITFNHCRTCGFEPHVQIICDDPYFVRKYISEKMGVALAPSLSWAERFRANTVVVPIDNPPVLTTSYLVWDENRYLTPAVQAFRDFIIQEARRLKGNLLSTAL